jgi:predicted RNA-binding protein with PUA-like domain
MAHWLLKTEPETFGIDRLASLPKRRTSWDGVRNYQARNYLRDGVRRADLAYMYHSSCAVPGIVGILQVVNAAYPDATAFDRHDAYYDPDSDPAAPRWYTIDVQLKRRMRRVITLDELRAHASGKLRGMALLQRGSRLSVMPVSDAHWRFILSLE